jgi:hypothetical protein
MQDRTCLAVAAVVFSAASLATFQTEARADTAAGSALTLLVRPHPGAQAIDVSGHGLSGQPLTVTLVSTIDRDLPDVVLSRTSLTVDPVGAFSAAISIAPGFIRGGIITVYVTSRGSGIATSARFLPDAPNRGVAIPLDDVPRAVR